MPPPSPPSAPEPGVPGAPGPPSGAIVEADRLVERLRRRGFLFRLEPDEMVRLTKHPSFLDVAVLTPEESEDLIRLKPHVLALLRRSEGGVSGPRAAPVGIPRASPGVRAEVRSEVHRLIGRLSTRPCEAVCAELAARLVAALGERDPARSEATYLGIARSACSGRGGVSPGLIAEAFDVACSVRRVETTRGAVFLGTFRRLLGEVRGRSGARRGSGRPN